MKILLKKSKKKIRRITDIGNQKNYDYDDDDSESLNVWDATDIWLSNGIDWNYMFWYTEEKLRLALRVETSLCPYVDNFLLIFSYISI